MMMPDSLETEQCIVRLFFDNPLGSRIHAHELRGAIGNFHKDETAFHHHAKDGKLLYRYPVIQYKKFGEKIFILGIAEGARLLAEMNLLNKRVNIRSNTYTVVRQEMAFSMSSIGVAYQPKTYRFISTWLALNHKNYKRYHMIGAQKDRESLLGGILIGNILSMSKGLDFTIDAGITARFLKIKESKTTLKGNPMLGFKGVFSINFNIPDYWGIGKSVSRGGER